MKDILKKCDKEDLLYISGVLDSYVSFTNDSKRKELLEKSQRSSSAKVELISLIDEQIRYYGSSDLGHFKRQIFNDDAGVSATEVIEDVCEKLKVSNKQGGSNKAMLGKLISSVVDSELLTKTPEELAKAFEKIGVGHADANLIMENLKLKGKVAVLPILVEVLGAQVALAIVETIVISIIAQIIGKAAAKQLLKEVLKRNPFLNILGPAIWVLSGVWLAFDLQGPAFRKTVPICLYLGIVALRDDSRITESQEK